MINDFKNTVRYTEINASGDDKVHEFFIVSQWKIQVIVDEARIKYKIYEIDFCKFWIPGNGCSFNYGSYGYSGRTRKDPSIEVQESWKGLIFWCLTSKFFDDRLGYLRWAVENFANNYLKSWNKKDITSFILALNELLIVV